MPALKEKKLKIFRNEEMDDQPFPETQSYKNLLEIPTELADINKTEGEQLEQGVIDIAGNTTNITQNAINISLNATDIAGNATNITINATGIATNVTDIAGNTTNITQNATNISLNATDIAGNTANITINATGIATNVTDIAGNASNITQNATDISLNVTDIAGNTANISVNATNINLRVEKDDVINQINISTEGILIAGDNIQLNGDTTVDGSFTVSGNIISGGTISGVTFQTGAPTGTNKVLRLSSSDTHLIEFMYGTDVIGRLEVLYNPANDLAGFDLVGGGGAYITGSGKSNMGAIIIGLTNKYLGLDWSGGDAATEKIVTNAKIDANWEPYQAGKDLGGSAAANKWQHLYLSGNIIVGGTVDGIDIASHAGNASAHHSSVSDGINITPASVISAGIIRASVDNAVYLGNSTYGFKSFYFTDAYDAKIYRGPDIHLEFEAANLKCHRNFVANATSLNIGSAGEYFNEVHYQSLVSHTPKVLTKGLSLLSTIEKMESGKIDEGKLASTFKHKKGGILMDNILMANVAAIKELDNRLTKVELN